MDSKGSLHKRFVAHYGFVMVVFQGLGNAFLQRVNFVLQLFLKYKGRLTLRSTSKATVSRLSLSTHLTAFLRSDI